MKNKKTLYTFIAVMFSLAALCFVMGTVNHILNTGEGVLSSVLLALGCACGAVYFFKKK